MKKTDGFVFDANTLISALLLPESSISAKAYYKAKAHGQIFHSEETFNEFVDVFIRPKFDRYLSLSKRLIIIEDLKAFVKIIPVISTIKACRDPKDDKYQELAVSSGSRLIVTGDNDLLVLHPFEGIQIMTPADFLNKP
jgi:putative PIN family toxin of toxin-antitoxin system